jgi:hypothetical protein
MLTEDDLCVALEQATQTQRDTFTKSINGVNNIALIDSDVTAAMGQFLQGKKSNLANARTLVRQLLCMWIYQSTNALYSGSVQW